MRLSRICQSWRMPDELWEKVKPLLPPGKAHPLGCHRPRVDDRQAMDAIFYMLHATLASVPVERPKPTGQVQQHVCLDKGYDYDEVREQGKTFGDTLPIRPRNEEAQELKREVNYKARRWVVERTHRWMNRFPRC